MTTLNFKHTGRLGDIVYSLAFVKEICGARNLSANYYILNDTYIDTNKSVFHPGNGLMVNQTLFDYLSPLLLAQDYIKHVIYCSEKEIPKEVIDLDLFKKSGANLKAGSIQGWYRKTFSMPVPLEQPWIKIPSEENHYNILINKSTRFYNEKINYALLKEFDKIGFVGLAYEYEHFKNRFNLDNLDYIKTTSALDLAQKMSQSRLFIGNQSLPFAIAEALKINRALDVYEPVPNVIPIGGTCIDFNNTKQLTAFLNFFFDKTIKESPDLNGGYVESILDKKSPNILMRKLRKVFKK